MRGEFPSSHLGAWLMRGWALYLGNLWDLNSSMEDIPGQLSSVGVPAEGRGGIQSTLLKSSSRRGVALVGAFISATTATCQG